MSDNEKCQNEECLHYCKTASGNCWRDRSPSAKVSHCRLFKSEPTTSIPVAEIQALRDKIEELEGDMLRAGKLLNDASSIYKEDCVFDINWDERTEAFLSKCKAIDAARK